MDQRITKHYFKYGVRILLACMLVGFAVQSTLASSAWNLAAQDETAPTIRIDRARVNLRSGPGTSYDIVGKAAANEEFNVVGLNAAGDWYEITLSNDENGWVYSGIVELNGDISNIDKAAATPATNQAQTPAEQPANAPAGDATTNSAVDSAVAAESTNGSSADPAIRIARTRVNLRSGPGTSYAIVGNASVDESYAVVGRNAANTWYEITMSTGENGWVYAAIVTLTGNLNNIDATEPTQADPAAPAEASNSTDSDAAAPAAASIAVPVPAPAASTSTAGMRGRLLYSVANMDDERWELWEYNFGTGDTTKINDWWTEIDVSKDGSQIVYFAWPTRAGDKDYGTWIMDRDYTNNRLVVPGGAYASFSPGGDRLVLNGGQDIFIINTDGGGLRGLTRGEYPSWSPINDEIVHRSCVGGGCGLWVIDANSNDANARRRLTTGGSDGQPAWSPNGQRIAYISQEDSNFEIYVINADGSGKQRLTSDLASDGLPVWSPDGQWIAFRSDRGGSWAIYAMRADGSDLRKIIDADVLPHWFFEKMDWF